MINRLRNETGHLKLLLKLCSLRSSAQSPAEKVKGGEVSTADSQMASRVPGVTRNSNLQQENPVTSDRVRIG